MSILWIVGGAAFMLAAVIQDPWGQSHKAAAMFLVGAAMFVIGIVA